MAARKGGAGRPRCQRPRQLAPAAGRPRRAHRGGDHRDGPRGAPRVGGGGRTAGRGEPGLPARRRFPGCRARALRVPGRHLQPVPARQRRPAAARPGRRPARRVPLRLPGRVRGSAGGARAGRARPQRLLPGLPSDARGRGCVPQVPAGPGPLARGRGTARGQDRRPLALAPEHDDPDLGADPTRNNDFRYHDDPRGLVVPRGAHIRRTNPRDGLADPVVETGIHRVLRRGAAYGPLLPAAALEDDGAERGIIFIFMGASLSRQFEFVQQVWLNDGDFASLGPEQDPLVGNSGGAGVYTIPARPVRRRLTGLPRFVTVRGGEYCFLPGLAAIVWLTTLPDLAGGPSAAPHSRHRRTTGDPAREGLHPRAVLTRSRTTGTGLRPAPPAVHRGRRGLRAGLGGGRGREPRGPLRPCEGVRAGTRHVRDPRRRAARVRAGRLRQARDARRAGPLLQRAVPPGCRPDAGQRRGHGHQGVRGGLHHHCNTAAHYTFLSKLFVDLPKYRLDGRRGNHRMYCDWVTGYGTLPPEEWAWDELARCTGARRCCATS